ncbi:MAG: hypothetical protein V1725_07425 [archaeon]
MKEHRKHFIKKAVIGFGLLSGLWINIGFDVGEYILETIKKGLSTLHPSPAVWALALFLFWLVPFLTTGYSLLRAYQWGRVRGLVAVGFAFLGGLFMPGPAGIIFTLCALVLALIIPVRA